MKHIFNNFRNLVLLISLVTGFKGAAQSCTITFTSTNQANGGVTFTATAPGANSITATYYWQFGDGSPTYSATGGAGLFANHTYTANGTYTVNVFVLSLPSCSTSANGVVTITNATSNPCNLGASFSRTLGANGLVNYTNLSTNTVSGTTYTWNFGDGGTSNAVNPSHTYTANGFYITTLIASNNTSVACTGTVQVAATITNVPCSMNASFTHTLGSNGNMMFTSTSTATNSSIGAYYWNFGDGGTSTQSNPSHIYANGTYTVYLMVSTSSISPTCFDSTSTVVSITNNTCSANANFSLIPTGTPKNWWAIPANTVNVSAATWSWGDGATSNTLMTSHQYSVAGMYSICLSVTAACGATATSCSSYSIFKASENAQVYNVSVVGSNPTGLTENKFVAFEVMPNPANDQVTLTFSDGVTEKVEVVVTDLTGKQVLTVVGKTTVDVSGLQSGVYMIKASAGQTSATKMLVITR